MSQAYDFNDAQPNTFEVIPDGTQVPVIFHLITGDPQDELHATKDGRGRLLKMEAVVTDGPYAKRKLFLNLMLATNDPENAGHQKAIDISKSTLRAIVEAARGFSPTDETPAAIAARKLKNIADIDKMECSIVVGIEKGQGTFSDKNVIRRVVPHGKAGAAGAAGSGGYDAAREAASMRSAGTTQARVPAKAGW